MATLRRLGKLRLTLIAVLVVGAAAFHIWAATTFVSEQPPDSKLYVQLAKNVLEHGVFSIDAAEPLTPTLIRLPGYPLFLAAVYSIFGDANEVAVRVIQGLVNTLTCLLAALLAAAWTVGRIRKFRAAAVAFVLAAICPFTLIYSAAFLTETLATAFFVGTLLAVTYAFRKRGRMSLAWWTLAGTLAGLNVLLRPDAGLFAFGIGLTIALSVLCGAGEFKSRLVSRFAMGTVFSLAFILPLVPWTIRNEAVFGVFQPLAPAHAEMPGEFVAHGYFLWLRTWIDDPKYIGPMLWDLELKPISMDSIPSSAFASDEERDRVAALITSYNSSDPDHSPDLQDSGADDESSADAEQADESNVDASSEDPIDEEWDLKVTPEVDAGFRQLANERIEREPFRFYVVLPAKRAATMWFDTHSEYYPFAGQLFPLQDLDEKTGQDLWLPLFAAFVILFTVLSFAGAAVLALSRQPGSRMWLMLVLLACVPRIAFFGTLENPEPRYLVELFIPAAVLCGVFLSHLRLVIGSGTLGVAISSGRRG